MNVLCTDFSGIELSPEIHAQLHELPICPLTTTTDLDQYDRILIYTDGSSQPSMRRCTPQRADELGHPDTWAMIVVGETFTTPEHSHCALLGWTAHPVRCDRDGSAYMQIDSLGSDMAEHAALIGAGAWRLGRNHAVTTVFCTDSSTGGQQAFGLMGAHTEDASFDLLRGIFQAFKAALGSSQLVLHHVRSHAGGCFTEFVDAAAKLEAKKSLNMQRQRIDMQQWHDRFKCLWVVFQGSNGMPTWHDGILSWMQQPQLYHSLIHNATTTVGQ